MKKVYCLYRVSTKQQVDKVKDDIPMQRIACQEFAERQGDWIIEKEFLEKGISGFKVSANDRDAIVELKEAAAKGEFDVLLVYMFDRIGRREDETPFVVENLVRQGVEVWSTQEGQQKFENHTDKLLNYIRFWQASGESAKTSMRLKTRMAQLTEDGIYHGGNVPIGYAAVHKGRYNKKGHPVKDIEIVPKEAECVRIIFEKTLNEGYGSYRLAKYINELGYRTHNGTLFQTNTINRILKNRLYCGYYIAGETSSPKIDELVIIDEKDFEAVQHILKQRSKTNDEKQHIARTTKGKNLLTGNLYCAHCGGRLISTSHSSKYVRKDGVETISTTLQYLCYHRTRGLNHCSGIGSYSARKVDEAAMEVTKQYLEPIKGTPKDKALEIRYKSELAEKRKAKLELTNEKERLGKRLRELSIEVGKSLSGETRISLDILSMSIEDTKTAIAENERLLRECDDDMDNRKEMLEKLDYYYEQFIGWADEFERASMEQKKMIISQLFTEIRINKDYQLEFEVNASYKQFFNDCLNFQEKVV